MGINLTFVYTSIVFIAGIITFIIVSPLFSKVLSLLPFSGAVGLLANLLLILLLLGIVYNFVRSNQKHNYVGGDY